MANKCDRCGIAKSDYKIVGADERGKETEVNLCGKCYKETEPQQWARTQKGKVVKFEKATILCAFCSKACATGEALCSGEDGVERMYPVCDACKNRLDNEKSEKLIESEKKKCIYCGSDSVASDVLLCGEDGVERMYPVCDACKNSLDNEKSEKPIESEKKKCIYCGSDSVVSDVLLCGEDGVERTYPVCDNCKNGGDGKLREKRRFNWTILMKVISICAMVISTASGLILGALLGGLIDEMFGILGLLVGGFGGFTIGVISISFTMVICEISTTLKEILKEIKRR